MLPRDNFKVEALKYFLIYKKNKFRKKKYSNQSYSSCLAEIHFTSIFSYKGKLKVTSKYSKSVRNVYEP